MPLTDAGANALVSGGLGSAIAYVSLHNGNPGSTGVNEATGGSPAYARQAVTWNSASSGIRTSSGDITFDVPPGVYYHVGFWSAVTSGTFYGFSPIGGNTAQVSNIHWNGDYLTAPASGIGSTDPFFVFETRREGMASPLTAGALYYPAGTFYSANFFKVATTVSGSIIDIITPGSQAWVQEVAPLTFANQGQIKIASGTLALDALLIGGT